MSLNDLSFPGRMPTRKVESMRAIASETAARTGLPLHEICGKFQSWTVSAARQEAFWRARHELGQSYAQIGSFFGRHHTTVIFGIRQHAKRMVAG